MRVTRQNQVISCHCIPCNILRLVREEKFKALYPVRQSEWRGVFEVRAVHSDNIYAEDVDAFVVQHYRARISHHFFEVAVVLVAHFVIARNEIYRGDFDELRNSIRRNVLSPALVVVNYVARKAYDIRRLRPDKSEQSFPLCPELFCVQVGKMNYPYTHGNIRRLHAVFGKLEDAVAEIYEQDDNDSRRKYTACKNCNLLRSHLILPIIL